MRYGSQDLPVTGSYTHTSKSLARFILGLFFGLNIKDFFCKSLILKIISFNNSLFIESVISKICFFEFVLKLIRAIIV